eukprot:1320120-Rhodomonas_salina.1
MNEVASVVDAKRVKGVPQDVDRLSLWCEELDHEREEKYNKWVALMMALHTRLGSNFLSSCACTVPYPVLTEVILLPGDQTYMAQGVVEDTWKLTCERALCLEFTLRLAVDENSWQDYPVQTPFSSCSIQEAIDPLCRNLDINIHSCELSLDWSTLAHRKSLRWNGVQDNSLVVMTEIPHTHLNLRVRNQHGTVAYFMVARCVAHSAVASLCHLWD